MSEVLIMKLELDPEVEIYMESEGVSIERAVKDLELYPSEAASTELEIVDRDDLSSYGKKGKDYLLIKKFSQLEKYEYELDDVLNELNTDIKGLKKLGVTVNENDDDEDD